MLVIGLTGGIGTGKTEVTRVLRELGAVVIEADKVAHLSYGPDKKAYRKIVSRFGKSVLRQSGVIDRERLGQIVFADPTVREELESIVWPDARDWIKNRLQYEERHGAEIVFIEVPKLFEAGWDTFIDTVWTVEASAAEINGRLMHRSGLTADEVVSRSSAQMSSGDRIRRADFVIENNTTIEDLQEKVRNAWENIPGVQCSHHIGSSLRHDEETPSGREN